MRAIPVIAALLAVTVACGGSPTGPSSPPGSFQSGGLDITFLRRGSMTASADGVPWTTVIVTGATSAGLGGLPGLVTASGSDSSGLFLSLAGPLAVGTHDLEGPSYVTFDLTQSLGLRWSASSLLARGGGALTITTATRTRVTGRFTFTAVTTTGASPETRTFTNGAFELSQ